MGAIISISQTNTFQVILATDGSQSYVLFLYENITWSEQTNIGFNAGDGDRFFTLPGATFDDILLDIESDSNNNITGLFMFRVDQDTVEEPTFDPFIRGKL